MSTISTFDFMGSDSMRKGIRIEIAATAMLVVVATATIAPAASAGEPAVDATSENSTARIAVVAVTSESADSALEAIPNDFTEVIGYRPVAIDGILANPSGDCSSPVTLPAEFETACKAHDLGYDLLRYADRSGKPLSAWARKTVDATLHQRMQDACSHRTGTVARFDCETMANIAAAFVDGNSWRQGYVSPRPEPVHKYVIAGAIAAIVLAAASVLTTRRRRQ